MADFGSMTEEQREMHYQAVCKAIDIDPALRLLDFIWMNHEQGPKSMVLYARRGAAEVLRQNRGISVIETTQINGDGFVSFIVKGHNGTGRIESAVGASSTKGLTGERLAYSVMTAHTRATRRLTLQFVGQGILDESEVNAHTADLGTSPASLATLAGSPVVFPAPQVPVTSAPGKDITPTHGDLQGCGTAQADTTSAKTSAVSEGTTLQSPPNQTVTTETTSAEQADIKADKPKRAPRKKRNTVDLATPEQQAAVIQDPEPTQAKPLAQHQAEQQALRDEAARQLQAKPPEIYPNMIEAGTQRIADELTKIGTESLEKQALVPKVEPKPKDVCLIAPEKLADYRARLAKYSQDILPRAGMMPSDGIGGVTMKLRKFAAVHTGATTQPTEEQWTDLLNFLDAQSKDPAALVAYINKAIGVAQ